MACAQSFTLWQQVPIEMTCHDHFIIACSRHVYMGVVLHAHPFMVNHTFNATPTERLQQHPLLFTTNCTNRTLFLLSLVYNWHDLHILVTAPFGYDRKARAACAQSFTLTVAASNNSVYWLQSHFILLVRATYIWVTGVVLCAHPASSESHIQCNANREVATRCDL